MSELSRLYRYSELLRAHRSLTAQQLQQRLEVSAATFKRDIAKMRYQLNMPIVYDRDLGGYRLDDPDDASSLPGVYFSNEELLALLTIQSMLDALQPGLLGPKLQPLRKRLDAMLHKQGLDPEELARRVRLVHAGKRQLEASHFETVAKATLERKRLQVVHFNRQRGERTTREISPQQLVHYRDNWYVDAVCHLRKDVRSFSVDAIESALLLATPADELDSGQLRARMGAAYGIFGGEPKAWAQLRFSAMRARWVQREQWHPQQKMQTLPDGALELQVPYSDERELIGDILRFGADVQVLAPAALKQRYVATLRAMLGEAE